MIQLRYEWRILGIEFWLCKKLVKLWVAGKLMKLAFRISPDLKKEMGF